MIEGLGSGPQPCTTCGCRVPGENRVSVSMSLDEIEEMAFGTTNRALRSRLICAMKLLDYDRAMRLIAELRSFDRAVDE